MYLYRRAENSAMRRATRIRAEDYWIPIIKGWEVADISLKKYSTDENPYMGSCDILKKIYILDMIIDFYEKFGKKKQLDILLEKTGCYEEYLNRQPSEVSKKQYKEFIMQTEHPGKHQYLCYLRGALILIARKINNISIVNALRLKMKFRYDIE